MIEKDAIDYYERMERRLFVDINFYQDELLIGESRDIAVPYLVGRNGFLAYMAMSMSARPHIIEVVSTRQDVDDLIVYGFVAGGDIAVDFILRPPLLSENWNQGFLRAEKSFDTSRTFLEKTLNEYLEHGHSKPKEKERKTYEVIEVGLKPLGPMIFETAGAIAVHGSEASFQGTILHQKRLPEFFNEKFRSVLAGSNTFSEYLRYLVNSGGQSEFSFSEIEEILAVSAAQAARIRLARAMRGTKHSRLKREE